MRLFVSLVLSVFLLVTHVAANEPDLPAPAKPIIAQIREANAAAQNGDVARALQLLDEAERAAAAAFGPTSALSAAIALTRANVLGRALRFEEASAAADKAVAVYEETPGFELGDARIDLRYLDASDAAAEYRAAYGECRGAYAAARRASEKLISRKLTVDAEARAAASLALAERALGAGDVATATATANSLEATSEPNDAEISTRLSLLRANLALSSGDTRRAAEIIGKIANPGGYADTIEVLRTEVDIRNARAAAAKSRIAGLLARTSPHDKGRGVQSLRGLLFFLDAKADILLGNYLDAASALKRAHQAYELSFDPRHSNFPAVDHSLGIVHQQLDERRFSALYYGNAIAGFERSLCPAANKANQTRVERTRLLLVSGDYERERDNPERAAALYAEAEGDARAVLGATGTPLPEIVRGYASSALGFALARQTKYAQAESAWRFAFKIFEKTSEADLPPGLIELSRALSKQGRHDEARKLVARAISILNKYAAVGSTLAEAHAAASEVERAAGGDKRLALEQAQKAAAILDSQFGANDAAGPMTALREHKARRSVYDTYVAAIADSAPMAAGREPLLFEAMQNGRRRSTTYAVDAALARYARTSPATARLLEQRRSLQEEWEALSWAIKSAAEAPDINRVNVLISEQMRVETLIAEVSRKISAAAPEFDRFFRGDAVPIETVRQKLLRPDEALLIHYAMGDRSELMFVTKTEIRVAETSLGRAALRALERRFRKMVETNGSMASPDFQVLHDLYREHLKPFEPSLEKVRHVYLVFDGRLQNMPVPAWTTGPYRANCPNQYLDAQSQKDGGEACFASLRNAPWLVKKPISFSYLPSVSALAAFSEAGRRELSTMLGVADPVFDPASEGEGKSDAASRGGCALGQPLMRDGVAITGVLRCFARLEDTSAEVASFANMFGASNSTLVTRADATESALRKRTDLKRFDLLVFATHAIMPGQFAENPPGLILTVPEKGTPDDDGLLTPPEIAQLDMSAELVILSACNTASNASVEDNEGYSGLARAFFFAGAENLLVSNWEVPSDSTSVMIPRAVAAFKGSGPVNREGVRLAEALRLAVLSMIEGEDDEQEGIWAHPFFWAAFVVVGRAD